MIIKKTLFLAIFLLYTSRSLCTIPLAQQFKQTGYAEICDKNHSTITFDTLYVYFDELIEFLQANPVWAHKLYIAKERFIRSSDRNYYSTNFFGFYDESRTRGQIAFYYATHFHEFIFSHYPELKSAAPIARFLQMCQKIQNPYTHLFAQVASELKLETIFNSKYNQPPILLKVVKYLPDYMATRPHYDGTALSLFLDSTDNQSLLLAPYKTTLAIDDFSSPVRNIVTQEHQRSIVLIPGTFLTELSIYPTPHIVTPSGKTRYATIAFAMRSNYSMGKNELSHLPNFKSIE